MVRKPTVARSAWLLLALLVIPGNSLAQFWNIVNPVAESGQGFRLYSLQGSASYYSNGLPPGYFNQSVQNLGYDIGYGGSAAAGYSHAGTSSAFSAAYSVGYSGRTQYTQFDAWNHSLILGGRRRLGRKWSASLAASANLFTSTALLFAPTAASSLAAAPATFDDLAAAILSGNSSNLQLASILTAGSLPAPAAQLEFYGYRSLAATALASISYAHSSRLSISATAAAGRNEHITSPADHSETSVPPYFLPSTTWVSSSLSVSYSLSPRTQVSLSASGTRVVSYLADSYTAQGGGSIGRVMGRHWFLQASAGSGYVLDVRGLGASGKTGYTASGSLGYKTLTSTFVGSFTHALGSNYGLGGYSTEAATGAWHWSRPSSGWSLSASGGWQRATSNFFNALDSWNASAILSRQLNPQISASLQYGYMHTQIPDATQAYKLNGVTLILAWSPGRHAPTSSPASTSKGMQ
jgi:hypothetical protein